MAEHMSRIGARVSTFFSRSSSHHAISCSAVEAATCRPSPAAIAPRCNASSGGRTACVWAFETQVGLSNAPACSGIVDRAHSRGDRAARTSAGRGPGLNRSCAADTIRSNTAAEPPRRSTLWPPSSGSRCRRHTRPCRSLGSGGGLPMEAGRWSGTRAGPGRCRLPGCTWRRSRGVGWGRWRRSRSRRARARPGAIHSLSG